nr:NosD domain-containing protein [Candidatus Sigynarchaeota archaeon]
MRRFHFTLLVITCCAITASIAFQNMFNEEQLQIAFRPGTGLRRSDPPLTINTNFQLAAASTGGDGSPGNPYIIENRIIDGVATFTCISITNTNKYFFLRYCTLTNGVKGLYFNNVSNAHVYNVTVSGMTGAAAYGIHWEYSDYNKMSNSTSTGNAHNGFYSVYSDHNWFFHNNISVNSMNGMVMVYATNNTIANSTMSRNVGGAGIGSGISFTGSMTYCKIANNTISQNNDNGILFINDYNSYNTIEHNIIQSNNDDGVSMEGRHHYNIIRFNTIKSNRENGVYLYDTYSSQHAIGNQIIGNTITDSVLASGQGVYLNVYIDYTRIENNTILRNNYGVYLYNTVYHTIVKGNNISLNRDEGAFFTQYVRNTTFDGNQFKKNAGYGMWIADYNCTVKNNVFDANSFDGIHIRNDYFANIDIINNTIINHGNSMYYGIDCWISRNVAIVNNTFFKNYNGLILIDTSLIRVTGNKILNCSYGFLIGSGNYTCNDSIISDNIIANNSVYGIRMANWDDNGISKNITIEFNVIDHNAIGIFLRRSRDNIFRGNNFTRNGYGIQYTETIGPNTFYYNNFMLNTKHLSNSINNLWNTAYPWGGNYWDNYTLVDVFHGPGQNISGADGIGDTPITLINGGIDLYPLMFPYPNDATSPVITLLSPVNASLSRVSTQVSLDVFDARLDAVWFNWDSGTNQTLHSPYHVSTPAADGVHVLRVYANDTHSNVAVQRYEFIVDTSPPVITLVSPGNNTIQRPGIMIDLTVTDPNLSSVVFNWNGSVNQTLVAPYDLSIPAIDGSRQLRVYAIDAAGNAGSRFFRFTVDGTPPSIILNSPANASAILPNRVIDLLAGDIRLDETWYQWDSGSNITLLAPFDVNAPGTDGLHVLRVYANDTASNIMNRRYEFTIDAIPPVSIQNLHSISHTTSLWSNDSWIDLVWDVASDAGGSGIAGYSFTWATSPVTPGLTVINNLTTYTGSQPDGYTWYFSIIAIDNAGNPSTSVSIGPFWIDTNPPDAPIPASTTHTTSTWSANVIIIVMWDLPNDASGSGVAGYSYSWTHGPQDPGTTLMTSSRSLSSPGLTQANDWYFNARSVDNAGLWSSQASVGPFYIDTNLPSTPIPSSPTHATSTWSSTTIINVTWGLPSDGGGSGVAGYSFSWTHGSQDPGTILMSSVRSIVSPALTEASDWYFNIRSVDGVGQWSSQASLGPFYIDTNSPAAPLPLTSTHLPSIWSTTTIINITWDLPSDGGGSGVAGYSYSWTHDAQDPGTTLMTSSRSLLSDALADASDWYFNVRSVDGVGMWSSQMSLGPFYIDANVPATPSLASPTHATSAWSSITIINVTWSLPTDGSGSGVAGYSYSWTHGAQDPGTTLMTSSRSLLSAALTDASDWYFNIRSVDGIDLWSSQASLGPFYIDTQAPSTPIPTSSTHVQSTWSANPVIGVSWATPGDGSGSGIAGYSFSWNFGAGTPDATIDTTSLSVTSTPLTDGNNWYFNIASIDNVGYVSSTTSIGPFFLDLTTPIITLLGNANNSIQLSGTVLNLSVTDTHLGQVLYHWNAGANQTLESPYTLIFPMDTTAMSLHVYASDLAGTLAAATFIIIPDLEPLANFSISVTQAYASESVVFLFTGSQGNAPATFTWSFSDGGSNSTLASPSHVFSQPGQYLVTLTVTDSNADSNTTSILINVIARPGQPIPIETFIIIIVIISVAGIAIGIAGVSKARAKKAKVAKTITEKRRALDISSPETQVVAPKKVSTGVPKEEPKEMTPQEKAEAAKTEKEITRYVDVPNCIVHKGPIAGANYLCPRCKTLYCINCAMVLKQRGEKCWSCGADIEISLPGDAVPPRDA